MTQRREKNEAPVLTRQNMISPLPCEHTKNRYAIALTSANWTSGTLQEAHEITSIKKMGSELLHARSQKPEKSQIRETSCIQSW